VSQPADLNMAPWTVAIFKTLLGAVGPTFSTQVMRTTQTVFPWPQLQRARTHDLHSLRVTPSCSPIVAEARPARQQCQGKRALVPERRDRYCRSWHGSRVGGERALPLRGQPLRPRGPLPLRLPTGHPPCAGAHPSYAIPRRCVHHVQPRGKPAHVRANLTPHAAATRRVMVQGLAAGQVDGLDSWQRRLRTRL
jgi:hypothetical protein